MKLFAIAAAVTGREEMKLTTSVIGGENKKDITLLEKHDDILDPGSEESIHAAFEKYLLTICRVVNEQRKKVKIAVPVVFGWPIEFKASEIIKHIGGSFSDYLSNDKLIYTLEDKPEMDAIERGKKEMEVISALIYRYLEKHQSPSHIEFLPRAFRMADSRLDDKESKEGKRHSEREREMKEAEKRFLRLKERAANRGGARISLKNLMHELGGKLARVFLESKGPIEDLSECRFFMTGLPKPPFIEDEASNCFHGNDELRSLFAEGLIRGLGIRHHIALKCPRDPSSPPFSDVAATYIADNLDYTSNGFVIPEAVMVKCDI